MELLPAHPLAQTVLNKRGRGWYPGAMADPFAAYQQELEFRDLDPKPVFATVKSFPLTIAGRRARR